MSTPGTGATPNTPTTTHDVDDTLNAMLDALDHADEGDDDATDESDTSAAAHASANDEAPAIVAPPVGQTPTRTWLGRLKRAATAKFTVGDKTPVVFADPIMAAITPTFTKLLVQSFEKRGLKGKWVTLENATPYGELPTGKLRLLQMDVYEVKNGLEMTSGGIRYVVPAGRFTHYIVRGPVQRNGYHAHSKKLGQQVAFDPNVA